MKGQRIRFLFSLLMLFLSMSAFAQQITVSGKVTDSDQEPIIGASVIEKGTSNGMITDMDGNFSLKTSPNATITISYIGYQTVEVKATEKPLRIVLKDDSELLDEVIVIGYGTMQKKDVTTSVATVSTKELNQRPIISTGAALQGKAAGVQITQPNGLPGQEMVIRVRGNSSISASNDPLYVVDGVPMTDISYLSPNDIESMQILKDASSAAIYGSRAANGVVLITTKSGAKGEAKIAFNTFVGFSDVIKSMKSLNHAQYKELMDETGAINLPDGLKDETDWFKETFTTGVNQNYQLSFSNGNDKMRYFISGGYTQDDGVIKVAFYKRYNFRANLENQIRNWFKLSSSVAYSDYSSNGIISGQGANRAGVVLSVINTPTYAKIWDEENPGQYYNNFYGANVTHPVSNMSRSADNETKNNRLLGNVSGEITFAPFLKFKSSFAIDRKSYHYTSFLDPKKTSYGREQFGTASDNRSQSTVLVFDNTLSFDKKFNKHSLSAVGVSSYTTSDYTNSYQSASHFFSSDLHTLNAGNKVSQGNGTNASQWAIMSYAFRAAYNYDSKYMLTANMRADGSSKLAPGNRWGVFPSVSAGWRVSSEKFMQSLRWINDLKIRGGWGQTGNQSGIGDYAYLQLYNITRQNWWEEGKANAMVTLSPANMPNRDLTWETTTQTNIGIDLSVLDNRLQFTADAYYKHTTNLLMDVPLPSTASVSSVTRNEGEMSNKGLEFSVSSKNFVGPFKWDTDFNISFNRNKVTKLSLQKTYYYGQTSESTNEKVVRMTEGKPLGMFWGYICDGVDPQTGDIIYRDIDKSGHITPSDKTYIGDPNPDFTFGLTNNFSYKGIGLNIFLTGSVGNDIYNASRIETEGMYSSRNQSTEVLRRWRKPGDITDMPRALIGTENVKASSRWIEDGSYLRVKNITLSYEFPTQMLKKIFLNRLQVYASAQNLITFTGYKGFDPEVNQFGNSATVQGIDWGTYPQVKTFVFGLNVEF
ncbi:TonB-dependent receptor [Bacteroides sp. GD17]|jgi:TonB-linked SusC/RagA family outer membrane protein|uniref:SusC/RagA family TonB-linked outer membrane protein n=1 Tax=Bacteroides sp. GD17 TaxID=3139826 RepID=UPI0025DBFB4C|nr:TonB-dependent receptor [uncultured Bacteroides sp.]